MKRDMRFNLLILIVFLIFLLASFGAYASDENEEIFCLARNIYFEAGNQPLAGKLAVGHVVINRRNNGLFPNTICEVVYDGGTRRNRCQFSWYCDGKSDTPKYGPTWEDSMIVAEWLSTNLYNTSEFTIPHDYLEGATHYHATYVYPNWASHMQEVVKIQDHIFYK